MAWDMKTEGLEELSGLLNTLGERAEDVAVGSLYEGAGVVADAFAKAQSGIRTERFTRKKARRLPSPEEKEALKGKSGIASFRRNGSEVDTLVGITKNAGYVQLGKRKTPVLAIARSINSGTSFMAKQPVYRKAASQSKMAAESAMVAKAEQMLDEIINN